MESPRDARERREREEAAVREKERGDRAVELERRLERARLEEQEKFRKERGGK